MVRELNADTITQCAIDDHKAFEEMAAMGVQPVTWSQEDIQELRELVREKIWSDWASKSDMANKVIEAQVDWLQELGRLK
jgi:glucan phosphorylase